MQNSMTALRSTDSMTMHLAENQRYRAFLERPIPGQTSRIQPATRMRKQAPVLPPHGACHMTNRTFHRNCALFPDTGKRPARRHPRQVLLVYWIGIAQNDVRRAPRDIAQFRCIGCGSEHGPLIPAQPRRCAPPRRPQAAHRRARARRPSSASGVPFRRPRG